MDEEKDDRKTLKISDAVHRLIRAYASIQGEQIGESAERLLLDGMRRHPAPGLTIPEEKAS